MASEPLQRLHIEHDQSAWLDNLRRDLVLSGELDRLIDSGIRGLTSNPTIFQKSIQDSPEYDDQFFQSVARGRTLDETYWDLVCTDIQLALAAFRPLFDTSEGHDGFVSVEVDPHLCTDGQETYKAARTLWTRLDQPNLMIKIPATRESLPAIRTMIASGANVNVTLIFGLERYREVMNAYINGLADRLSMGLPIDSIASVASFFISRVDTEVDNRLNAIGTSEALALRGRAAVCQAKIAYSLFRDMFSTTTWNDLAHYGAAVQRPLWASTSTKNPAYSDTLYVDELIGPHTVNTLPDATIRAFCDHGKISRTIDSDLDECYEIWESLEKVGVDVDDVARVLESEGVASFQRSFDDLMLAMASKRT